MLVKPVKTRIFREGENLLDFVARHIGKIRERTIIVVTSKIVALSEGRTAVQEDVRTKEKLIRAESDFAARTRYGWMTVKDGMVMASAGIDQSNGNGKFVLLPKDAFGTARELRRELRRRYNVKKIGVLITDSRTIPLRSGTVGIALGYAGFRGIRDYRGKPDIFGRKFKFSRVNVADGLAAAAVLVMGEGEERQPLAVIQGAPVEFCEKTRPKELYIGIEDDMYRQFFKKI